MLESITIRNFQCLEKQRIDLDPAVNTIVGPTDVGKSANIRALKWLTTNKPSGDAFIRHGEKQASVCLKIDGHEIIRERGSGLNSYLLDGKKLQAFGTEVPEEIARLLNLGEENFQDQFDAPFLLAETAGEVARSLNRVINLNAIDEILAAVGKRIRESKVENSIVKERLRAAREERDRLEWVKHADNCLSLLELHNRTLSEIVNKRSRIDDVLEKASEVTKTNQTAARAGKEGSRVVQIGLEGKEIEIRLNTLSNLIEKTRQAKQDAKFKAPKAVIAILDQLQKRWNSAREEANDLGLIIDQVIQQKEEEKQWRLIVKDEENNLKKQMGDRCPLCLKPM
jgi:exonuclease SbcC